MKTHVVCFVGGAVVAWLAGSFCKPEVKTVEIEKIRTVAVPAPLVTPTVKAKDSNFADVRISPHVIKLMMMGAYRNGQVGKTTIEFLLLTPDEVTKCHEAIERVVAKLKKMEEDHMRITESENGETLVIDAYWEKGGREEYETLRSELKEILGDGRGNIMAMGVGQCTADVGTFGYYQTQLHIEDGTLDKDGNPIPELHVNQEAPFAGVRKLIDAERDPVKKQQLIDDYTVWQARDEAEGQGGSLDAPFSRMAIVVPATDQKSIARWRHVFDALEGDANNVN